MAGGKATTFENDLLKLIFAGTTIANIANNASASPLTSLYISLHTADPGVGGTQVTNETTYSSYARYTAARTTTAWTITSNSVSPAFNFAFPASTGGSGTLTYAAVGVAVSGASKILYRGPLTSNITIANGVVPTLTTSSALTES
jgi:hypothetical protein